MRIIRLFNSLEGNSFENKVTNTLNSILKQSNDLKLIKLNFFINSSNPENFKDECNTISGAIKSVFKKQIPAYTLISQPSIKDDNFIAECHFFNKDLDIKYKSILNHPYVTVHHKNGIEVISGGIQFNEESLLFSLQRCFDFAEQILMAEELNFGHIHRQWNYIPQLSKTSAYEGLNVANSEIFDTIKSLFYEDSLFTSGYPIETLTGSKYGNSTIDFIAFSQHSENINVIQEVIEPDNTHKNIDPNQSAQNIYKPANAKFLNIGDENQIWIASTHLATKEVEKINDAEQQIMKLFNSMFRLIDTDNIKNNHIDLPATKKLNEQFEMIKIYVKNISDIKKIKEIVTETLPDVTQLIIHADLPSDNRLVEIEGLINASTL